MRSYQNIVITCLVVAVLAAIWIPTVSGDIAKDPWLKWIYNYQTLITGFVAAGAAYLTVREMRNSTGQQLAMLQKQLAVQLLPDQRAFKRFYEMIVLLERYHSTLHLMAKDSFIKKEYLRANKAKFFYTLDKLNEDLAKFKIQTFVIPPYEVMKVVEVVVDSIIDETAFFRNEYSSEEDFTSFYKERADVMITALGMLIDTNKHWVINMYPDIEQWQV